MAPGAALASAPVGVVENGFSNEVLGKEESGFVAS